MMRCLGIVLGAFGCGAVSAQAASVTTSRESASRLPALDSSALLADLSALAAVSMAGRRIGTPGGARARTYLVRALGRTGLTPASDRLQNPCAAAGRGGAAL